MLFFYHFFHEISRKLSLGCTFLLTVTEAGKDLHEFKVRVQIRAIFFQQNKLKKNFFFLYKSNKSVFRKQQEQQCEFL